VRTFAGIEARVSATILLAALMRVSLPADRFIEPEASKITITLVSLAKAAGARVKVVSAAAIRANDFVGMGVSFEIDRLAGH
jgi:hypothetical protein